jgi:toxin-antitoxin system PIN domain toxin
VEISLLDKTSREAKVIHLLDLNLLLAIHHPKHPNFAAADLWFLHGGNKHFATCPITQSGMMRLLLQGVAGLHPFDREEARNTLQFFIQQPGHVFWPDNPTYLDATQFLFNRLQGHRQTTDAYLLGLALHNKGKLATVDRGVLHLAGKEFAAHVEFIDPVATVRAKPR